MSQQRAARGIIERMGRAATLAFCLLAAPAFGEPVPDAAPSTPVERAFLTPPTWGYPDEAWPIRPLIEPIDAPRLLAASDLAFAPETLAAAGTRALLVIHRGAIVHERYADGWGPESRHVSWSMAKSITQAGIGLLVGDGRLALDQPAPVPEWTAADDPRHKITIRNLLTMTSGLDWADGKSPIQSDEARMLFGAGRLGVAAYAASKPLALPPGQTFRYSSGNSNILARIITDAVAGDAAAPAERREAMRTFFTTRLFRPIGITSAVLETDKSGNFIGGSGVFMTAQDYARFGYLYLRGGEWANGPVLPAGWAAFSASRGEAKETAAYGAHFWLMTRMENDPLFPPSLPGSPTAFAASGNEGQIILIVPDRELVIVRLGNGGTDVWPTVNRIVAEVAACFPLEGAQLAGAPQSPPSP